MERRSGGNKKGGALQLTTEQRNAAYDRAKQGSSSKGGFDDRYAQEIEKAEQNITTLVDAGDTNALVARLVALTPDIQEIGKQAGAILNAVRSVTIATNEGYAQAMQLRGRVNAKLAEVEEKRKAKKAPFLEAGKTVDGYFDNAKKALGQAKGMLDGKITKWDDEQERARREAEEKAEAELAEQARRLEAKAEQLEAKGRDDEAAELREAAQELDETPVAALVPARQKVAGGSIPVRWYAEVESLEVLAQAVLDGKVKDGRRTVKLSEIMTLDFALMNREAAQLHKGCRAGAHLNSEPCPMMAMKWPGMTAKGRKGVATARQMPWD